MEKILKNKEEEELDPEDVELDEHYTIETRSKCKQISQTNLLI